MAMITTVLGYIELGIDGKDMYLLIRSNKELTKRSAEEWLADAYMFDTDTPGSAYCHNVYVTPHPTMDNAFIGLVQFRYDV